VFADANGDVELHLSTIGSYNVANGPSTVQVVSSKAATAPAAPATTPATTPASGPDYPCLIALLIVVLLIIAGAVYYWQGMKKK